MDPFVAFSSYPSQTLTSRTELTLVDIDLDAAIKRARSLRQLAMVDFATLVLPTEAEIVTVLSSAAGGWGGDEGTNTKAGSTAAALVKNIPAQRRPFVFRSLTWLLKLGILKVAS